MKAKIILLALTGLALVGGGFWFVAQQNNQQSDRNEQQQDEQQEQAAPSIELSVTQENLELAQKTKRLDVDIISDDYGSIARVDFFLDEAFTTYSTRTPFSTVINLSNVEPGVHELYAEARGINGQTGKSNVFRFTLKKDGDIEIDSDSQVIVGLGSSDQDSSSNAGSDTSSGGADSGSGSSGGSGGSGGGGSDPDPDPDPDPETPWPAAPPALVCDNSSLLSGPSSAPTGAVIVPAGDNGSVNFQLADTTYWFAPGTHTLGTDPLDQIIPGNNSTFVGAPGAILDGQNINSYAFTQDNINVTIQYLTIQNFETPQNEGAVNHDSGVGWTMEYLTAQNNGGGGIFAGTDNVIRYSCMRDNGQYGFQVYSDDVGGPQNVTLDHNEISGNNTDDWENVIDGCGCTGGGKLWEATNIDITNNYVHDNLSVGIWADTNDVDFLVEGNYIEGNNGQGLFYETSYNMIVRNNNFIGNGHVDGAANSGFPTGAVYLSEAGGDSRVPSRTDKIEIYDNNFEDNWAGVILWENADRFCASPANTSSGTCTLVNPSVANLTTCDDPANGGSVDEEPYYSDCRWKTQNVEVHDNVFSIDKDSVPNCNTVASCGFQGIFSNTGTFPSWSPYMGDVIQDDITYNQNNVFSNNTYTGDWLFKAHDQGVEYNFAIWQNTPFNQDVGSTFNGESQLLLPNALDEDSATLEGSIGEWISWFSATPSRSNEAAHTGSYSLKVDIDAEFGWGIQQSGNVAVTPYDKNISFWARLGSGTNLATRMQIVWRDIDGNALRTDDIPTLANLTSSWQQTTGSISPPAGTITAMVRFVHASGTAGNYIYLDDIIIADEGS